MKKIYLTVLLVAVLSIPTYGLDEEAINQIVDEAVILSVLNIIDGTAPLPPGGVWTSANTYLVRGNVPAGEERLIIITTNNILGVVAVAITHTGLGQEHFRRYSRAVNGTRLRLENTVVGTNSIRGTLMRSTGGRRYSFSMDYSPQNRQLVKTVTRQ